MQWSCPHCGVILAVADDALGTGWSFSRCYKCGGFALIRRAEINIIKVDKAPPGEKVILPEASNDPAVGLMNGEATQRMAKYVANKNHAQTTAQTVTPPPYPTHAHRPTTIDISTSILPEPLPETGQSARSYAVPIGISAAAVLMVISGIYLYVQGQSLWLKAREAASKTTYSLSEENKTFAPPASLLSADTMPQEKPVVAITDQVQKSAMAPEKLTDKPIEKPIVAPATSLMTVPEANHIKNSLHSALIVKVRSEKANLHSGPGMNFPVVGAAVQEGRYQVADWNNRWFKLQKAGQVGQITGWVRNDLVQVLADPSH